MRKTDVIKHKRKLKKGGKTTVNRHKRTVKDAGKKGGKTARNIGSKAGQQAYKDYERSQKRSLRIRLADGTEIERGEAE